MRKTGKKAIFPARDIVPGWQDFLGPALPESASLFVALLAAAEPEVPHGAAPLPFRRLSAGGRGRAVRHGL